MAILVLLTAVLAGAAEPETSAVLPEAIPGPGSAAMVRFLAWCAASGVDIVGAEFVSVGTGQRDSDRGTIATRDLAKGAMVLATPLSAVLNIEHALNSERFQALWDEVADDLSDIDLTAAFLCSERDTETPSSAESSAAFLGSMPTSLPTNPLYFTELELASLDGLLAEPQIRDRIKQTREGHRKVTAAAAKVAPELLPVLSWDNFRWASAVLRSRSHMISIKDPQGAWQRAMCLVPAADMVNMAVADAASNLECSTDASAGTGLHEQRFVCRTTRAVEAGEELVSVYLKDPARRTSSNLLLDYGFVAETNPNDAVVIKSPVIGDLATAAGGELAKLKKQALGVLGRRGRTSKSNSVPKQLLLAANRWPREKARFFAEYFFFFRVLHLQPEAADHDPEQIAAAASAVAHDSSLFDERAAATDAMAHLDGIREDFAERRIACELASYTYGPHEASTHIDRLSTAESIVLEAARGFLSDYSDGLK